MDFNNGTTWLFQFLFCNIEKSIVWCISAKKNYYSLTKNNHKFLASVTERGTWEKVRSLKNLYYTRIFHKWFLRFPVRFFLPIYRSLFVSYMADIFCVRKKVFLSAFTVPVIESKRKISLSFSITFAA